jgi:hypothetical protein
VGTGHHIGKTWLGAAMAVWALVCFPSGITVLTTAPTFKQVEQQLWRGLGQQVAEAKLPIGGHLTNTKLEFAKNVFAIGLATDKPTSFQGFHNRRVLVIVDEAAGVDARMFGAVDGVTTGPDDTILMLGNTTSDGLGGEFHACFTGKRESDVFQISTWESAEAGAAGASERWCRDKLKRWGENDPEYLGRVMGQWPDESTHGLISYVDVQDAINRAPTHDLPDPVIMGIDVARFGDDRTAWVIRQGEDILAAYTARKQSIVDTWRETLTYASAHRVGFIVVDDTGLGGGLTDMLAQQDPVQQVVGINFGAASRYPEEYENRRAEIWFLLRDWFKEQRGAICIKDSASALLMDLTRDCVTPRFKFSKTKQRRQLESKDDMKKRTGGSSPDLGDALGHDRRGVQRWPGRGRGVRLLGHLRQRREPGRAVICPKCQSAYTTSTYAYKLTAMMMALRCWACRYYTSVICDTPEASEVLFGN